VQVVSQPAACQAAGRGGGRALRRTVCWWGGWSARWWAEDGWLYLLSLLLWKCVHLLHSGLLMVENFFFKFVDLVFFHEEQGNKKNRKQEKKDKKQT
jgi:hypothetical protein